MTELKHYRNFRIYKTEFDHEIGFNVIYHMDEKGRDWYYLQKTFQDDTYKVGYNEHGVVVTVSKDAWALPVTGLSIIEVYDLPIDFSINGEFEILDGEIVRIMPSDNEIIEAAKERRRQLIDEVTLEITILKEAEEVSELTQREQQRLESLKEYRVKLMRVDITKEGEVWPEKPRSVL